MKITDIRVNQIEKPVGFMMEKPVFSWISESDQPIDAYRICINEDGRTVYDSGFAALDPLGCEADFIPKPRTRYDFVI